MAETLAYCRYFGFPAHSAMPRTFVAIHASLGRTIDLTRGEIRHHLRVSLRRLIDTDWRAEVSAGRLPITQAVGVAASTVALEAMVVPSAAEVGGRNLVIFPDNLLPASRLEILNPKRLGR